MNLVWFTSVQTAFIFWLHSPPGKDNMSFVGVTDLGLTIAGIAVWRSTAVEEENFRTGTGVFNPVQVEEFGQGGLSGM